jgi:hypothetical protein
VTVTDAAPSSQARSVLASFTEYADAQATVDRLSDQQFPVEHVAIIGYNVRIEEQVTGRMTNWTAAGYGAASGAWFGLLIGLLFGLLSDSIAAWILLLLLGLGLGALWGAVFGFVGHAATRGRRDFSSVKQFLAERWDVTVRSDELLRAQSLLANTTQSAPAAPSAGDPATPRA